MNPDLIEPGAAKAASRSRTIGGLATTVLCALAAAVLGGLAVLIGCRLAVSAVIDLGPTDAHYVRGFRDIERDGTEYFRWATVPSSSVEIPLRFCGPGSVRLRVRRHFTDPATLTVLVGGQIAGQTSVEARTDHPYRVLNFKVLSVTCKSDTQVLLESVVQNDRPLGVAVDWVEVNSLSGFGAPGGAVVRGAVLLLLIGGALCAAGGTPGMVFSTAALFATLMGSGFAADPVAAERILRGGGAAALMALVAGCAIAFCCQLQTLSVRGRLALLAISLAALVSRAAFFHPQAFYPDYRVHALVQQTLNRLGLPVFLSQLFEIQYERSLGLQEIDGNWYPFPYPPGAYVLTKAVGGILNLDPLDSITATALAASALIPMLTLAIGRSLGLSEVGALASAAFVALQPLLVRRMALGYFPSLIGQVLDAVALLLLLGLSRGEGFGRRRLAFLALTLLGAFLVYTQSIANFGLFLSGVLAVELVRRTPKGLSRTLQVALAAGLALGASYGGFYWRYSAVLENVAAHRPQPETAVLDRLDRLRQAAAVDGDAPEGDELNDPYAGPTLNPLRGFLRLGSRLWRFNGPFALAIPFGLWLLWGRSDRSGQTQVLGWAGVALWISLLASGLPSPNGFRHLKDLEFVSPLIAIAQALLFEALFARRRWLGLLFAGTWIAFAVGVFDIEFGERLMRLVDR